MVSILYLTVMHYVKMHRYKNWLFKNSSECCAKNCKIIELKNIAIMFTFNSLLKILNWYKSRIIWLIECIMFSVLFESISHMPYMEVTNAVEDLQNIVLTLLCAYGHWARRDLYCAMPAMIKRTRFTLTLPKDHSI